MPVVPPSKLTAIPKKQRSKFVEDMYERAVANYVFSWKKLMALVDDPEALMGCVAAFNDGEAKELRNELNERIAMVMAENGIKTLRDEDPFGRAKDYILQEGVSTSCPRDKVLEIAAREFKIDAAKLSMAFDKATKKTPYVTVQARDVKGGGDE